jgi:N-acetylglutamate synthase-like GNAT family acetyltransferase
VAVAVDDEWQGGSIGRRLVAELLSEHARAEGIERLLAHVAPDNRLVVDWAARAGVIEASDRDAIVFSVALDRLAESRRAA